MAVTIRSYRPGDHSAGRRLWVELAERHRALYEDPGYGGADPGAAFEDYLTRLDLSGMWVADHGRTGGGPGRPDHEGSGGRDRAGGRHRGSARAGDRPGAAGARGRRGAAARAHVPDHLPESRNVDAIRSLHAAGYDVLSAVQLTLDLGRREHEWRDGIDMHELRFKS
ncbi:hypothetical protein Prum_042820 [Phytohabitans rumicis]|uniref:N-acetyltransferase domain-containing protein n=1 Tax=Phytohabitans rumicis TaxID=1076125 RepID=A0A6V8L515_9ACTN|nr:hypothetical protein Prum_042820 [Phytohabitans rumicis]